MGARRFRGFGISRAQGAAWSSLRVCVPSHSEGRRVQMCGTGSMENQSRLYFPNPANLTERRFCVAECPVQVSQTLDEPVRLGLVEGDSELLVRNGSTSDSCFDPRSRRRQHAADASPRWPCFYPTYPTIEAFYKCVPVPPPVLALSELEGFPAEARIYTAAARFVAAPLMAVRRHGPGCSLRLRGTARCARGRSVGYSSCVCVVSSGVCVCRAAVCLWRGRVCNCIVCGPAVCMNV